MTAIVGFNCRDGVVLGADTLESYGDNKAFVHKLYPEAHAHWRIGLVGAGIGYLIDYAKDQIFAAMREDLGGDIIFESRLKFILDKLYAKEFKQFPVSKPIDRQVQMLIGVQ